MNRITVVKDANQWSQILAEARSNRADADQTVTPEEAAQAVPGAYFIRLEPDIQLTIYGEILEPQNEEDKPLYRMSHMRFVRLTRCYSAIEPEGEYGNVHIASMAAFISKEDFELFRSQGWPSLL